MTDNGESNDFYGHLRERADIGWERVMQSPLEVVDPVPGSYPDLSHKLLFGDIWQRPHLTLRERRLIVLTLLAVYGRDEPMIYHLRGALRSGDLDVDDLDELVVQLAFYGGWPMASMAFLALRRAAGEFSSDDQRDAD